MPMASGTHVRPRRTAALFGAAVVVGTMAALVAGAAKADSSDAASSAKGSSGVSPRATVDRYAPPEAVTRLIRTRRTRALSLPRVSASLPPATTRTVAIPGTPCGPATGMICSQVPVPLDRTGAVPGSISLKVVTVPWPGPEKGVMFLIAGGPGQGSARVFGLDDLAQVDYYRFLFPGYTLVAVDNRGTGESGLLNCPGLQGAYQIEDEERLVGECAAAIGPNRQFYGTRDHAEDLEAVRVALGAPKVGLWGTSYGTKLSVAYALAHPGQVDRLLLDSVVPTDLDDPFRATTAREMPKSLSEFCAPGCPTTSFAADVAAVANTLAAAPVRVPVLRPNGGRTTVRVMGIDVLSVVVEADLNPGLAAQLPAIMRAARARDYVPLARLVDLAYAGAAGEAIDLSSGLFAATVCSDGPFPWSSSQPVAGRRALFDAAVQALPAGTFGTFGTWAAQLGNGHFCLGWPEPSGHAPLAANPLPNVPVLAVNGGFDMRTPTASAQAVASKFPQAKVVVVPAVGHSVLSTDFSFCSAIAVNRWMRGLAIEACSRAPTLIAPVLAYPTGGSKALNPNQTLDVVRRALSEASAAWVMGGSTVAGVRGGRLVAQANGYRLVNYAIIPGVTVSGTVTLTGFSLPLQFRGFVRVGGPRAASGVLSLRGRQLGGALGGVVVG